MEYLFLRSGTAISQRCRAPEGVTLTRHGLYEANGLGGIVLPPEAPSGVLPIGWARYVASRLAGASVLLDVQDLRADVVASLVRAMPTVELVWADPADPTRLMTERDGHTVAWTPRVTVTPGVAPVVAPAPVAVASPPAGRPATTEPRPADAVASPVETTVSSADRPDRERIPAYTRAGFEQAEALYRAHVQGLLAVDEDVARQASLIDIRREAYRGTASMVVLASMVDAHLARYPVDRDAVSAHLAEGRASLEQLRALQAEAYRARTQPEVLEALVQRTEATTPHLVKKLIREIEFFTRRVGHPDACTVVERGEHRLPALAPSTGWKLVIDETGDCFHVRDGGGREGRFVVVAIPDGVTLPPAYVHGVHVEQAEGDACMQAILNAPVGVLGIRVAHLALDRGLDWEDGIIELLSLALRLLPVAEGDGDVNVSVVVEQRGAPVQWDLARRALTRELAHADAARARRLRIDIQTVPKGDDPHLAYADIVAHAWGATRPDAHARLRRSGLLGRCLLTSDHAGRRYRRALDAVRPGMVPDAATWWWLIAQDDALKPHSIANVALSAAERALRAGRHGAAWSGYLDHLLRELDGATPDLRVCGAAANWLVDLAPEGAALPPRAALALGMTRLALGNHAGTVGDGEAQLQALARTLEAEAAPLACLVDLHVAVRLTNRFDFEGAAAAVAHLVARDERVSGLRYHGRVLSTVGQHLAFVGRNTEARARFSEALACFDRLGEAAVRDREREQTAAYLAIATMDDATATVEEGRAALALLLGSLEDDAIRTLTLGGDESRFKLHVLFRWLAEHPADPLVQVVLDTGADWVLGQEHPWQLIEFYRGLVCAQAFGWSPGVRSEALTRSARWARDQALFGAPTLQVIGLVMGMAAEVAGVPFPDRAERVHDVVARVPLARPWVEAAANAVDGAEHPLEVLRLGLPFNFR